MKRSCVFLFGVLALLFASSGSAATEKQQKTVEGIVVGTHQVFAHCVVLIAVADRKEPPRTLAIYFPPEERELHTPSPCDLVYRGSGGFRAEGAYERASSVSDLTPENAGSALVYSILQEALADTKEEFLYFHGHTYQLLEKPDFPNRSLSAYELKSLRGRMKSFLHDVYIARNEKRSWSYVSRKSSLRTWGTLLGAFFYGDPDPTTFSSWPPATVWDCVNNSSADGFCVVRAPNLGYLDDILYLILLEKRLSTKDKIAIVAYAPTGDGYEGNDTVTLWVEEQPGILGRLASQKPVWKLLSFDYPGTD